MSKATRDQILSRVTTPEAGIARSRRKKAEDNLDWEDLGLVAEGLSLGQRPIRAAAREITRRYDLGTRGAFILSLIAGGVTYPLELALALKTSRSNVSGELARLTAAGLVRAKQGAADKRRSELALTPLGELACKQVHEAMERILRRNLAGYSAKEVRLFARMLRDVRRLADDEAEGD